MLPIRHPDMGHSDILNHSAGTGEAEARSGGKVRERVMMDRGFFGRRGLFRNDGEALANKVFPAALN
jgi:hypothetical protein